MAIDAPFQSLTPVTTLPRVYAIWKERIGYFTATGATFVAIKIIFYLTLSFVLGTWILEAKAKEAEEDTHDTAEMSIFDLRPTTHILSFGTVLWVEILFWMIIGTLGEAAMCAGVARLYIGQSPSVVESFAEAWSKKFLLIRTACIVGMALMAHFVAIFVCIGVGSEHPDGMLAFQLLSFGLAVVVAYVILGLRFTYAAIVIEGAKTPKQAMQRSWELSKGSRRYIARTHACLWLVFFLVSRLLKAIFTGGTSVDGILRLLITLLCGLWYFPLRTM